MVSETLADFRVNLKLGIEIPCIDGCDSHETIAA
jgi:hypothetical protein